MLVFKQVFTFLMHAVPLGYNEADTNKSSSILIYWCAKQIINTRSVGLMSMII